MNKRSAVGVEDFMRIALVLIVIAALLWLVWPKAAEVLGTTGEKGACEWSVVVSGLTSIAGTYNIPIECKAKRFEIDKKMFEKEIGKAEKRLDVIYKDKKYESFLGEFKPGKKPRDQLNKEAALNTIIAREMVDCWDKVWKGKLPMFDKWWRLYEWTTDENKRIEGAGPKAGEVAVSIFGQKLAHLGTIYSAPINCIICSRIKFADDIKSQITASQITSLNDWMAMSYPKLGGKSYLELMEGQSWRVFPPHQWRYSLDDPLAIVFIRVNVYHQAGSYLDWINTNILGGQPATEKEINFVKLLPYTQDALVGPKSAGGEGCTYLLD